jgi:hypothetical protein
MNAPLSPADDDIDLKPTRGDQSSGFTYPPPPQQWPLALDVLDCLTLQSQLVLPSYARTDTIFACPAVADL